MVFMKTNVNDIWVYRDNTKVSIANGKKEIVGELGMINCIKQFQNTSWYINAKDEANDFPGCLILK